MTQEFNKTTEKLFAMINSRHQKKLKNLLKNLDLTIQNEEGWTLLFPAAKEGNTKLSELLIKSGVNVNHKDISGNSALKYAIHYNKKETARMLIKNGADIRDCSIKTEIYHGNTASISLLIEEGAELPEEVTKDTLLTLGKAGGLQFDHDIALSEIILRAAIYYDATAVLMNMLYELRPHESIVSSLIYYANKKDRERCFEIIKDYIDREED